MVIHIPLSKTGKHAGKYVAIVSDEDKDLAELSWHFIATKSLTYAHRWDKSKKYPGLMHRIILSRMIAPQKLDNGQLVDHINGDTLDNTRGNLRIANKTQNAANSKIHSSNKTGYRGVSWDKLSGKFRAQIGFDNRIIYIGLFDSPEDAYEAYCEKAKELHGGEYTRLG